ncbi:arginine/serine-rich coiled-coil protein 2 isoform X2 [Trifolium pratense]|uniref:arginine/serine-rich coiled-coil protein 2 isoform X2 n=1 Tax=Trifolium pratense TaxID=57577 RepID=UPI001E6936CC|nr:arginine/serine-rich coiled-coil protein 2 isoform X2 [Trifolium pratense]XP_045820738.1 arginine/serine-rich coiled-coil protein 2 isoform X2 [Trifolium pratense]
MDSNSQSPHHRDDDSDTKNAFRKPSGEPANRNYRRRSPIHASSSPTDGSPRREHSSSPYPPREDSVRVSHHHSRKYDGREQDQKYGGNRYGRSTDSLRHSDRQSSRSSYGHSRHDKYADEDRKHERFSSRSGRDHMREESDSRSKDYRRSMDKYSREKYERSDYKSNEKVSETYSQHRKYKDMDSSCDRSGSDKRCSTYEEVEKERRTRDGDGRDERKNSQRNSGEHKSDRAVSYSESRSQKDDIEISKNKDRSSRKVGEVFGVEDKESSGKKPKLFGADKDDNSGKDDERKTSGSKFPHESRPDLAAAKTSGFDNGNNLDAAKVAAMRAAELVNKNLVGANSLTTDQKKKLLWGSKKSTPTEESGHRWDMAMFDRERQEKFNKLMGVKGEAKVEQNSDNQNDNDTVRAEKQKELQLELEKQYTAGLRRRDGRTVGLGL